MKSPILKWIIAISIIIAACIIVYIVRTHPYTRTSLHLNSSKIDHIEFYGTPVETQTWVDFFNSLELTYSKYGLKYNRVGDLFVIYYVDGTTDTILFHSDQFKYNEVIYNFHDIYNDEGKAEMYNELLRGKQLY